MQAVAEKLFLSEFSGDQVIQQLSNLFPRLRSEQQQLDLLDSLLDQIFSSDSNTFTHRSLKLLEFTLEKKRILSKDIDGSVSMTTAQILLEKTKNTTEIEVLIICFSQILQQLQAVQPQLDMKKLKQIENMLRARLYKFLNTADQFVVWGNQYIVKFQQEKETQLFGKACTDKRLNSVNLLEFNYNEQIYRIKLIFRFMQAYKSLFPLTIDFSEILFLWSMNVRCESDKPLLQEMLSELFSLATSKENILRRPFFISLELLRLDYKGIQNSKEPFDCRAGLTVFLKMFDSERIGLLTKECLPHFLLSHADSWHFLFKNLFMMSTDQVISSALLALTRFMICNKIFAPLQKILDCFIAGLYTYIKFSQCSQGAMDLLTVYLVGSSCQSKTFQKHSQRIQQILLDKTIQTETHKQLLQLAQCFAKKYQENGSNTETTAFNEFICSFKDNEGINWLSEDQISEQLKRYDWMSGDFKGVKDPAEKNNNLASNPEKQQQDQQNTNGSTGNTNAVNSTTVDSSSRLKGLQNLGNTCYMNSYLQALYMTREFRYRVLQINLSEVYSVKQSTTEKPSAVTTVPSTSNPNSKQTPQTEAAQQIIERTARLNKVSTVFQLQKVFALLFKSKRDSVNPKLFKNILPDQFRFSHSQHDASEFGRIFLDQLERSVKNTNDKKMLDDYFIGQYSHVITCMTCKSQSRSSEKFLDISLSFREGQNTVAKLSDLIDDHFKPEVFEGDNKYECGTCGGKQEAKKESKLAHLPKYVIVTLNRFHYDLKTFRRIKLLQKVEIQEIIDLKAYLDLQRDNEGDTKVNNDIEGAANSMKLSKDCIENSGNSVQETTATLDGMLANGSQAINQSESMMGVQEDHEIEIEKQATKDKQIKEAEQETATSKSEQINEKDNSKMEEEKEQVESQEEDKNISQTEYELYAMVVHRGQSAESGHYFSYARDDNAKDGSKQWQLFDDSIVSSEESLNKIFQSFSATASSAVSSSTPYLLFYQQRAHARDLDKRYAIETFSLSERLRISVEIDEANMMKEMETGNKVASMINQIKLQHTAQQIFQPYQRRNNEDEDSDLGGGTGSLGGFGAGFGNQGGGPIC